MKIKIKCGKCEDKPVVIPKEEQNDYKIGIKMGWKK